MSYKFFFFTLNILGFHAFWPYWLPKKNTLKKNMVLRVACNAADVIWPSCDGIVATHGPDALYIWMQPNFGLIVGNCVNILEEIPKCNLIYVCKHRPLLLISFHLKFFHTFLQIFFLNLKLINFHGCKFWLF